MRKKYVSIILVAAGIFIGCCFYKKEIVTWAEEMTQENSVSSLQIEKNSLQEYTIKEGKEKTLTLSLSPETTTRTAIGWESTDEEIVAVTTEGTIQAKKSGTCKVRVYSEEDPQVCDEITVTVVPKNATIYKQGFYYEKISAELQEQMDGESYHENPYIKYSDLRYVSVKHYGYNGKITTGELVVNKKIAKDVVEIFYKLYKKQYPIQRMKLIDAYHGNDNKSMKANNTSAFNYRLVEGSTHLSKHAYGLAIDLNPRVNPYITSGGKHVSPANGKVYAQRNAEQCKGTYRDNMIHKGDYVYRLFRQHGFFWGGDWNTIKDYQHFEWRG